MAFVKKWSLRLLLFMLFLGVLLLATDNSQSVALSFMGYRSPEGPLSWWIIGAFVLGVVLSTILNLVTTTRLKWEVKRARHDVAQSEKALDKVKAEAGNAGSGEQPVGSADAPASART